MLDKSTVDKLADLQDRWLNEPMEGYGADWAFMLNLIYRLQDELDTYQVEQQSLAASLIRKANQLADATEDLELEKKHHTITLNLFEKAIEELASWREKAQGRTG